MTLDLTNSTTPEGKTGYAPKMPDRRLTLEFYIDTNRINARGGLPSMKKLEEWHRNGVISIQMPQAARHEITRGKNAKDQIKKAKRYICSIVPGEMQTQYQHIVDKIEKILFPSGAKTQNQIEDVRNVFDAAYYMAILVTNEGDSKRQPGGILGNRNKLAKIGIEVMRDWEAVELVKEKIRQRDERARKVASMTGQPLPEWVGTD
jgi:hypothetical protein